MPSLSQSIVFTILVTTALAASADQPQTSVYCRKVKAHATGDASLLMAPQVVLQALRVPTPGDLDLGVTDQSQQQVRAGLAFSPLDFYRGLRVIEVADADCAQQDVAARLLRLLSHAEDVGRLVAVRQKRAFLEARQPEWRAVLARAEARFGAREATLVELTELRSRAAELERRLAQASGEAERLEARSEGEERLVLADALLAYRAGAARYEADLGELRTLDAWDVKLTGGVVPRAPRPDWYGVVQLGFNLGGFSRNASERRYLAAREEERREAWYEIEPRLRAFRVQLASTAAQTRAELATIEREAAFLVQSRSVVERSAAPGALHVLFSLALQEMQMGADRAYAVTLLEELAPMVEEVR